MLGWRSRLAYLSHNHGYCRYHSTAKKADNKHFSSSILLPRTRFPLRNDPSKDKTIQRKTTENLYRWQWEQTRGPLFVFHDGPPYANGDLHMGHALNKILKDIINRYHTLLGERVHYVPGWDCHGLPIEQKVLKSLGKDVHEVSSIAIRQEAEKYAKDQVESQLEQFRHLGIMAGWTEDTTYRTLDHDYEMRQLRVFQKMVERGLIYRQHRPVHYSPSSRSALAEAELEYKDAHVSHSVYVSFELDRESVMNPTLRDIIDHRPRTQLLVWTTTPWTLTANMGIAVNPEMVYTAMSSSRFPDEGLVIFATERRESLHKLLDDMSLDTHHGEFSGADLAEAKYHPLFHSLVQNSEPLPILSSAHVTPESGTGLVHCAPAHGHEDYALFRSHGMTSKMLCHVNDLGQFSGSIADIVGTKAEQLVGKDILEDGGKSMVDILKSLGSLKKVERVKHRYPYDWKTDKPVIIMATSQWFANLDAIKEDALAALKDVHFYPAISRNRLEAFVRSRSEWCISRQRVWGVPIPALYHLPTNRAVLTSDSLSHILSVLEEKGTRHWWDGPVADFVPEAIRVDGEDVDKTWVKGTDTMDVWFDSGTSWSMLTDLAKDETSPKAPGRYADVCLEGSDQHRGWFQSQLLTAVAVAPDDNPPAAPYGTLITHGMVLDENDKKMSKSLGNILSPLTIINGGKDKKRDPAYGAEVLRLWVATVEVGRDMNIGPKILSQSVESLRKIRNSARFLLGNLRDQRLPEELKISREKLGFADRYAMHKLHELETTAREGYTTYNFPKVVSALSNFANITLSTLYFDITKDALYCEAENSVERLGIITVMERILDTMTSVMAPILPHLAEEVHSTMHPEDSEISSVFYEPWKPLSSEWHDPVLDAEMSQFLKIRDIVLRLLENPRRNKQVKTSLMADVDFVIPKQAEGTEFVQLMRRELESLKRLLIVSQVELVDEGSLGTSSPEWVYTGSIPIPGYNHEIGVRVRPAEHHKCPRCWTYVCEVEDSLCDRCSTVIHT